MNTSRIERGLEPTLLRHPLGIASLVSLLFYLAGCSMRHEKIATFEDCCCPPESSLRQASFTTATPESMPLGEYRFDQTKFATPEEASNALVSAVRSNDLSEIRRILGPGGEDILSSGDEVADRQARERFLNAYDEKNELAKEPDGSISLQVGMDDWPMPIPIVPYLGGWRFDTPQGREEILNRRIGRNELSTREVLLAIVDAQKDYMQNDRDGDGVREYAQKIISDPGMKNGLYWETSPDEPPSPLGPLVAEAMGEGYGATPRASGERRPYHGYYFKLLTFQGPNAPGGVRNYLVDGKLTGGFGVIAWPADYGNSGIKSFQVSHDGILYEDDLGPDAENIASTMAAFDPDPDWDIENSVPVRGDW